MSKCHASQNDLGAATLPDRAFQWSGFINRVSGNLLKSFLICSTQSLFLFQCIFLLLFGWSQYRIRAILVREPLNYPENVHKENIGEVM